MNAMKIHDRSAVRVAISACFALAGAWLAWQCGAGLGSAVAAPDNGSPILWMLGLLAMSVVLLLLATRTRHQRMFTLAFLPMLIFTPMAYELSSQEEALAFFTAFVGVISPLVIIEILVWHYRKRAAMAVAVTPMEATESPIAEIASPVPTTF
jgi:hypothetical protein